MIYLKQLRWIGHLVCMGILIICVINCALMPIKGYLPRLSKVKKIKSHTIKKQLQLKPYHLVKKARKIVTTRPLNQRMIRGLKNILKKPLPAGVKDVTFMILAQHYLHVKSYKKSLHYYSLVQNSPWKEKAKLEKAKIYYYLNQYIKAEKTLMFITHGSFSLKIVKEAYRLQEMIVLKYYSNQPLKLLRVYSAILKNEVGDRHSYQKKAQHIIFSLRDQDILNLVKEDFIQPVQDWIYFRAGKILFYREKFKQSYRFFKKALKFASNASLEARALKYVQAIESRKKVNTHRIGAILPLSGSSASIGKRTLQGLQLGLGFYTQPDTTFQLAVLDSQGLPDEAKKAVKNLVMQHHVIGIIGGVLSKTALAIADEAQNFGVPAILLSQKAWITRGRKYIFQNSLSSHLVVDQIIQFLMNQLSIKRFALLYPNDSYGVDYANNFWSAVEQKNGIIVGAQVYKPGETDFNGQLQRLVGTYYKKDREQEYREKLKKWYQQKTYHPGRRLTPPTTLLEPQVDFKVLFVPDSAKVLSLIASHLAYNDIKDVYLTGPVLWNQGKTIRKQSKYVNKIFFADTGLNSSAFKESQFYQIFYRIFGHKAGLFETQAYESALVFRQLIVGGIRSRSELKKRLSTLKRFHGPIGWIHINQNREFIRPLPIFKIENKKISLVSDPVASIK